MRTSRSALVVLAVAAAAVLSGCAGNPGSPTPPITVAPSSQTPSASTHSPVGSWGDNAQGKANVIFTADKRLSGNDGCNHFSGSWKQGATEVEVDEIASTLMACPGADTWLATMTAVKVDGNTLHVFKGTDEIGTLARM